ncbi:MAG TPA: nucleotidyltransferase domain-containing protein [Thermoanaerobaculia bacterium]|nr:nucleotidyltransferase domain-containing protein [Thermoanaerobaculia bacterium]
MKALDLIEKNRDPLGELCRRYAVHRLRLFGSAAAGDFDPSRSDFDFLVEFDEPIGMNSFHQFFGFRRSLADLLARQVDLVVWSAVKNPYFRQQAAAQAVDVYAA